MADDFQNGTLYPLYVDTTTPTTTAGASVIIPGNFELVACLQDNGFDGSTDQLDTSSKCSGVFKDSIPGQIGWTFSGNGNAINPGVSDNRVSHNLLFDMWKNQTVAWFGIWDDELSSIRYGLGYISSFGEANPNNAAKTFSITVQGKGEIFNVATT